MEIQKLELIENRFNEVYFTLSESDIIEIEKSDNGPLNNVISNINKECFGVMVFEDPNDYTIEIFMSQTKKSCRVI